MLAPRLAVLGSGYRPSLDLNFLSGALDPRITFTRATNASYFDSTGTLQIAGSGVPRFDYDPVTLAARGLLIEGARTNKLLNSETLSTQSVTTAATAYTLSFYGTGTVTLTGTSTAGPLVGTGANQRVSLTFTPTAGSLTLTVSGTVKYANLEAGAVASSWIQTIGAEATRNLDDAQITGSNFSDWYNPLEGTFVVRGFGAPVTGGLTRRLLTIDDGTSSNRHVIGYNTATNGRAIVQVAAVVQADLNPGGVDAPNAIYAYAYKVNDFALSVAGTSPVTDAAGTIPAVLRAVLGQDSVASDGTTLFGQLASFKYYRKRLPDAMLRSLSA